MFFKSASLQGAVTGMVTGTVELDNKEVEEKDILTLSSGDLLDQTKRKAFAAISELKKRFQRAP